MSRPSSSSSSASARMSGVSSPPAASSARRTILSSGTRTPQAAAAHATITPAVATRTADQLDRIRLDGRLGALLAYPFSHAQESRTMFQSDVAAASESTVADRLAQLRSLEAQIEQDDWMFA